MTQDTPLSEEKQAHAHFAEGRFAEAEILFRRLAEVNTIDASAYYNLGVTLAKLGRFEEALNSYRTAITLHPGFAEAYTNFGFCLNQLNLIQHARQGFAIARTITPDDPIPALNEGIAALALGDYTPGWQGFAARWQLPAYAKLKPSFDSPSWHGEELAGKTLFLYAEQGFGDSIQMARYIPLLAARGARVVAGVQLALAKLMQNLEGAPTIITKGDPIPDFDFHCAMMDIPGGFGTIVSNIPANIPYLHADEDLVASYKKLLPPLSTKSRVGLSWAGRSDHENDSQRSLHLSQLAPLLNRPDISWISLQRNVPEDDVGVLSGHERMIDWGRSFPDFSATAAAIMTLDLVITVDSAIAHLAGALGKPVWVLLPFNADWRWLMNRADSPWYPTARLFRQKKRGDWESVIADVAAALQKSF